MTAVGVIQRSAAALLKLPASAAWRKVSSWDCTWNSRPFAEAVFDIVSKGRWIFKGRGGICFLQRTPLVRPEGFLRRRDEKMLSKQTVRAAIEGKGGNAYFSKGAFCDSSFFTIGCEPFV